MAKQRPRKTNKSIRRRNAKLEVMREYAALRDRRDERKSEVDEAVRSQLPQQRSPDTKTVRVSYVDGRTPPPRPTWGRHNYGEYMQSSVWAARRRRYFAAHPRRCRVCGVGVNADDLIHLHHLSYEHMGNEPDGDLMALCEKHHASVHDFHSRSGDSLREATATFVDLYGRPGYKKSVAAAGRAQSR